MIRSQNNIKTNLGTINKKFDGISLLYSLFHLTKEEVINVLPQYRNLLNKNGKILLILQDGNGEQVVKEPLNKDFWINKDIDSAVSLFGSTTFYQETPFMKPYITLEEINEEWQHNQNVTIQFIEIILLAIDGYTVIAHWILKQNNEKYDGIYEIKFNGNLGCLLYNFVMQI